VVHRVRQHHLRVLRMLHVERPVLRYRIHGKASPEFEEIVQVDTGRDVLAEAGGRLTGFPYGRIFREFPVLQVLIDVDVAESVASLKELLPRETKAVRNPGESLPRLEPIRVDQVRSGDDVPYRPFVVNDFRRGDLRAFGRIRKSRAGTT